MHDSLLEEVKLGCFIDLKVIVSNNNHVRVRIK